MVEEEGEEEKSGVRLREVKNRMMFEQDSKGSRQSWEEAKRR